MTAQSVAAKDSHRVSAQAPRPSVVARFFSFFMVLSVSAVLTLPATALGCLF